MPPGVHKGRSKNLSKMRARVRAKLKPKVHGFQCPGHAPFGLSAKGAPNLSIGVVHLLGFLPKVHRPLYRSRSPFGFSAKGAPTSLSESFTFCPCERRCAGCPAAAVHLLLSRSKVHGLLYRSRSPFVVPAKGAPACDMDELPTERDGAWGLFG